MNPHDGHPLLGDSPRCQLCNSILSRCFTLAQNRNGNAGRPMYRCGECRTFVCFGDMRGVDPENPLCECPTPHPSRAQVAGERDGQILPRAVYFGCAIGQCRFFGYVVDDENEVLTLPEGPLDADELVGMGL